MRKIKRLRDSAASNSVKSRKTGVTSRERQKILSEIHNHEDEEPFYKRLFKRKKDDFIFLLNTGEHVIKVDPKYKIRSLELKELKEFCRSAICGGGDNTFSYEINDDFIEITADVVTNFAVLKVSLNKC